MRPGPIPLMLIAAALLLVAAHSDAATPRVANVSAAMCHTVVLLDDGTVWTWGQANTNWSILGTGYDQSDGNLHRVNALSGVVAVDAKFLSSLALDKDGHVWAWGDNRCGQCGDVPGTSVPSPAMIGGLERIVQVSAGGNNGAAVDEDGNVWAWGDNFFGQLGAGSVGPPQYKPAKVPIDNVRMVSAGTGHMVALKRDGTVWAWGANDLGMVGSSGGAKVTSPVKVEGLWGIVKVDAGYDHTLALRDDGTVWGWGDGEQNKLCNGQGYYDAPAVPVPVQVNGLPRIADVSGGKHFSTVLAADGAVYAWGSNGDGEYGNNIDLWTPALSPVQVPGLADVASLSAGFGHTVVVRKDGSVWAWGRNYEDQIRPGLGNKAMSPVKKIDGSTAIASQAASQRPTPGAAPTAAAAGADMAGFVTIAGVVILGLAVALFIVLLRLRRQ